jgi:RHS repeat-associated protein
VEYDPRARTVRTVRPDGAEERVIFGVPDQGGPDRFTPTPWEIYTYDANDTAGRTSASGDPTHRDTPGSVELDALGRTVASVQRNGRDPSIDWYVTRFTYDIRGNLLTVTDPLNRVALRYAYDLADRRLRVDSLDAGIRRTVLDAAGNEIERRDGKGALVLQSYDSLHRPLRRWARDSAAGRLTLREQLEYGDGSDANQAAPERDASRAANRLGQLHRQYDEAGVLTFDRYDFKGNLTEKRRQVLRADVILHAFERPPPGWRVEPFRVQWEPPPGSAFAEHVRALVDPTEYRTSIVYDGLSRMRALRLPAEVGGVRRQLRTRHDRVGALQAVDLDGETYVRQIAYNARGQPTLVAYGNGVMTRYAHDPRTFRVVRLRTERYAWTPREALRYRVAAPVLQDLAYTHDLAGNVVAITDRTPGCGVRQNPEAATVTDARLARELAAGNALVRRFAYDPLYRLRSATGRESRTASAPRPWTDEHRPGFDGGNHGSATQGNAPSLTRWYREEYAYDPAGNLVALTHREGNRAWTRRFGFGGLTPRQWDREWRARMASAAPAAPLPNRLSHVGDDGAGTAQTHAHDPSGNLTTEAGSRHLEWDHSDRLKAFRVQTGAAEPSIHAQYLSDPGGQRVMKVVRRQGGRWSVAVYIDGLFEHHYWRASDPAIRQNTLVHVMGGRPGVAIVRSGDAHPGDAGPPVQYHVADHLGSSHLVISDTGDWINREEYFPYGETGFGSFARKRYRFGGKERDEESGLHYHGARYYASWLARWVSCDPRVEEGANLFVAFRGDPINKVDPAGSQSFEAEEAERLQQLSAPEAVPRTLSLQSGRWIFKPNIRFRTSSRGVIVPQPGGATPERSPETLSIPDIPLRTYEPPPGLEPNRVDVPRGPLDIGALRSPQYRPPPPPPPPPRVEETPPPPPHPAPQAPLYEERTLMYVWVRGPVTRAEFEERIRKTGSASPYSETDWKLVRRVVGPVPIDWPQEAGGALGYRVAWSPDNLDTFRSPQWEVKSQLLPHDWSTVHPVFAWAEYDLPKSDEEIRKLIANPQVIRLQR